MQPSVLLTTPINVLWQTHLLNSEVEGLMDGRTEGGGLMRRRHGSRAWRDSQRFWHICPSSVPAALTQSPGHTNTHWLKVTLSWLCLAMLPACGLQDLPLCRHQLKAALVQHRRMFMWPSFKQPNVPLTDTNEIMLSKKNPFTRIMCAIWLEHVTSE